MNNTDTDKDTEDSRLRIYGVRLTDSEIAEIRDMTKVDLVGPAVRSIVLKAIERHRAERDERERRRTICEPSHESILDATAKG